MPAIHNPLPLNGEIVREDAAAAHWTAEIHTNTNDVLRIPRNVNRDTPEVVYTTENAKCNMTPRLDWNSATSAEHQTTYYSDRSDEKSKCDGHDILVRRIANDICPQGEE